MSTAATLRSRDSAVDTVYPTAAGRPSTPVQTDSFEALSVHLNWLVIPGERGVIATAATVSSLQ